ncbi:MAG: hypothetical protein LBD78_04105 [Spirochaetaceae bacterium]|jgi:hypothetical protein|nr:hypothetical protein [Spirochaetaceae bacterium]
MVLENVRSSPFFPHFTPEFGYNCEDDWFKASLRILFFFPSSVSDKLHSRTPFTLYNIIKSRFGTDVFVDICMEPPRFQVKAYAQEFPILVGAFSHRTWHDFDIVGVSVAIAQDEFAEAYRVFSLEGFPLSREGRLDDGETPLLVMGGIAASCSNGLDGVVDLILLGLGEGLLPRLVLEAFAGQACRGSVARAKRQIIDGMRGVGGVCCPGDYPYGWYVDSGAGKSYPVWKDEVVQVKPDTLLGMGGYDAAEDMQWGWPVAGVRRASVVVSWGCAGGGACNFCAEGNMYGPWRERGLGDLSQAFRDAKRSLMGETVSFQSFNSSYYSRFPELLMEAHKYFDLVSMLNFRLDELAASVRTGGRNNYLALARGLGSVVVAGAVEGFGERVRNKLYNKNLSFGELRCVAEEVFRLKFMKFKTGYILSGHETSEEIEEGLGEIREIADLRRSLGASTQYVVSVSKLVHFYGTPVYVLPRVASYLNWMETFGGGKAYYPFFDLPGSLVSVKSTGGIGETFVQQLHQDLPGELCEKVLLEPAVRHRVMSRGYLDEVRARLEGYGIRAREQFLDFNPNYSPKQHYKLAPMQERFGAEFLRESRSPCLRTLSSGDGKLGCHGCRACSAVQFDGYEMDSPFRGRLLGRDVSGGVDLSRVRAVKALNAPAFHYAMVFRVGEDGKYVSKDALVRLWFSRMAWEDGGFITSFRRFSYSFSGHMEYSGMVSNYYGYEAVVVAFRDRVDIGRFKDLAGKVNEGCPTIKFVWAGEVTERPTVPGYWILSELRLDVSAEGMGEVLRCFVDKPFRYYAGSTYQYREVRLPFYYRVARGVGGLVLFLCLPGKVNPAYNLLELWHYNKFNRMLLSQNIRAVMSPAGDRSFADVVTGKVWSMGAFSYVEMVEDDVERGAEVGEVQGA